MLVSTDIPSLPWQAAHCADNLGAFRRAGVGRECGSLESEAYSYNADRQGPHARLKRPHFSPGVIGFNSSWCLPRPPAYRFDLFG